MAFPPFVLWSIVIVLAVIVFAWHWTQSKAYSKKLAAAGREQDVLAQKLLSLSYDRAFQVLFLWGIVLATLVYANQRVSAPLRAEIESLKTELSVANEQLAADPTGPQLDPTPTDTGSESYQAMLDGVKERFEPLFINYYYLKRCNMTKPDDFHLMNSALLYALSEVNAPSSLQYSILTAAKGSHDEMYAESPCTAEATDPLRQNVEAYLQSVRANLPN